MQEVVSMDLSQEMKMVTRKESSQAGGCHDHHHDQPASIVTEEATEKVNIIIHQKASSLTMEEKYASLEKAFKETTQSPNPPLIQRVPYMLRDQANFEKYYEPRVVAIGPLHHDRKPHLQPAEQLKRRLAAMFVKDTGRDYDVLYNKIWTEIGALRKRFDPEETKSYTDEQLAWMLFVDGCAVLHLIKCKAQKTMQKLRIKNNQIALIWQDLFLLENQIPFRVLELLTNFDSTKKWRMDIDTFVTMNTGSTNPSPEENPVHLLHLFRKNLLSPSLPPSHSKSPPPAAPPTSPSKKRAEKDHGWHIFRNVKDLKSAGIFFESSPTRFLTDVFFKSWCFAGKLTLPELNVDDSTGPKFMNLIAYEMCPDYENDFMVTSYICFMDSLVDQADDVLELRKSRILLNYLGSDEEVAKLFNEISTDLVPNPTAYMIVKKNIEKHCGSKWKTWMAQAYHDHFSSPWTIVAFLGAAVALVLTAIQTWFGVFPR